MSGKLLFIALSLSSGLSFAKNIELVGPIENQDSVALIPDPNPYDPNPYDPNPYDPIYPDDPSYPDNPVEPPVEYLDRTIFVGQILGYERVNLSALLRAMDHSIDGAKVMSIEVDVARVDRTGRAALFVNGGAVDSARLRRGTLRLNLGQPAELNELIELQIRGQIFVREVRFHLVRESYY